MAEEIKDTEWEKWEVIPAGKADGPSKEDFEAVVEAAQDRVAQPKPKEEDKKVEGGWQDLLDKMGVELKVDEDGRLSLSKEFEFERKRPAQAADKDTGDMEYFDLGHPKFELGKYRDGVSNEPEMLYARAEQIDIKSLRAGIPDFEGKVAELSSNARVLATEHLYKDAQQKVAAYKDKLSDKYKDAPILKTGADLDGNGFLSYEEKQGLATISSLNHGVVRVEESEKKQLNDLQSASRNAGGEFFKAVNEESEKLFPEGTARQQTEIGNGFHNLRRDAQRQYEREQSEKFDAPSRNEALKEGHFVQPMDQSIKIEPKQGAEVTPPAPTR